MAIKLPKLPRGEGTMAMHNDTTVVYKKVISLPHNQKKRVTVYGETPQICMQKMRMKEFEMMKETRIARLETLEDAMNEWLDNVHKQKIKPQSYSRLKSTIKNQIGSSSLGKIQYQSITGVELQQLLNDLNTQNYSHSVIKKTHDVLNCFFRYVATKDHIDNPMTVVSMPTIGNIQAEQREIQWFEEDEIERFVAHCGDTYNNTANKFKYGYILAANIYMGMRGGELLALQWKDIDFEKNTVYVSKTLVEAENPDYDVNDKAEMRRRGIKRTLFYVQENTKTSKNRYVPINSKAKTLLLKHYDSCQYTLPDDYVISTSNRKTNTLKNLSDTIKAIEEEAEINKPCNTHILRHTCASLYFKKGVPIEVICQILGNSREVCEKTYVHFVEEQLKDAASKIDIIEI